MNTRTLSLKSLSGGAYFGTWRGFWSIQCVLDWSLLLLYWMLNSECLDGFEWGGWGIYSPQPLPSRWQSLLAMGAPDSPVVHRIVTIHWLVHAMLGRPLGFGAVDRCIRLSFCCTGQSGVTPDSPVTSDLCAALFDTVHLRCRPLARMEALLRWLTG
jgi:hypothetical protein